jgi:hypothetical protein
VRTIMVRNQADWDALPDKFKKFTNLELRTDVPVIIKKIPGNSSTILYGNSCAALWGNSRAEIWENSRAVFWGDSTTVLKGSGQAVLRGNSRAVLRENSRAELWENSRAVLYGNSRAELRENSQAELRENSQAVLWGNSSAALWERSRAALWETSLAKVFSPESQVKAEHHAVVILEGVSPSVQPGPGVQVIRREPFRHNLESFRQAHGLVPEKGEFILYKLVRKDFTDIWSKSITYLPGETITYPDWDLSPERRDGGGLYLSATPEDARRQHLQGRLLLCAVKPEDMVVHPDTITEVRCRQVRVLREVETLD